MRHSSIAALTLAALGLADCAPESEDATPDELASVESTLGGRMGVDYSFSRPSPASLKAAGFTFACRYLSPDSSKNISLAEAQSLIAAGVDVVANWEADGHNEILAGYGSGAQAAQLAAAQAKAAGMADDRPIYFSIDFDAQPGQQAAVDAFMDGAASVIGRGRVGAYGGYSVIKRLFDGGKIAWGWQTYAWSYGRWEPRAQLRQIRNSAACGGGCDIDEAVAADFGQWSVHAAPPDHGREIVLVAPGRGYVLMSNGDLRPFGGAPEVSGTPRWSGDLARDVAMRDATSGYILDGWGGVHPFGGAPTAAVSAYWPNWDIARALVLRPDHASGYVLDGWGGLHPFGGAPELALGAYWPNWDIARDVVLRRDGKSGYVLDGWGALHPFGGAPAVSGDSFKGTDFARKVVLGFDDRSGYVLDLWGGLHPFGGAPPAESAPQAWVDHGRGVALDTTALAGVTTDVDGAVHPLTVNVAQGRAASAASNGHGYAVSGTGVLTALGGAPARTGSQWSWNIARDIAVRADGESGYVLDGWGGVHPFGGAPALATPAYWPNWDIARALLLHTDGTSGYLLDGWGALHPFGGAPAVTGPLWKGWDIARSAVLRADGRSGYLLDAYGGVHAFGGAPATAISGYWSGWDIARDLVLRADGQSGYVLEGFGGLHPFGNAPALANDNYWPGWDVAKSVALRADGTSGYVVDAWGRSHPFGGAP